MEDLNRHQLKILNVLLFKKEAKYSELNSEKLPTNQFNYHIKGLLVSGYVNKELSGYVLTTKGKSYASKIDIFSGEIEKQGKISVLSVCIKNEGGINKYLIHQRKKHPNYGYIGFPAGKAKFGLLLMNEVLRELEEETGLTGDPILKQVNHILVRDENGNMLDDKVFFIFLITNLSGKLVEETIEGINKWMSLDDITSQEFLFPDVLDTINIINDESISFVEREDSYDL